MTFKTRIAELLGIEHPIVQGCNHMGRARRVRDGHV